MEFFNLPATLAQNVLSSWIEVTSLARLDTAVRFSKSFGVFSELISSPGFALKEELNLSYTPLLKWLENHSVRVETFELDDAETDEYTLTHYMCKFGTFVRKAMFLPYCTTHGLYLVAMNCANLETVYFTGHEQVPALCELLKRNLLLTELRLQNIDDKDFKHFDFVPHLPLKHLSIISCIDIPSFPFVTFMGPKLRKLHLESNDWLTQQDLVVVANLCTNLEALALINIATEDDTLAKLTKLCPRIVYLDLARNEVVTDAGILSIVQNLPHLEMIALCGCQNLTYTSMEHLYTYCRETLCDLTVDVNSGNVEALTSLLQCGNMCYLGLVGSTALTTSQLDPLFASAGSVQELLLTGTLMSDEVLCLVGKYCHNLRELTADNPSYYTPNDEEVSDYEDNEDNDDNEDNGHDHGEARVQSVVLDAAPCALAYGCPLLHYINFNYEEVVNSSARRLWSALRPQLYFDFSVDSESFNICDYAPSNQVHV